MSDKRLKPSAEMLEHLEMLLDDEGFEVSENLAFFEGLSKSAQTGASGQQEPLQMKTKATEKELKRKEERQ